jgi:hypothetical protein
MSVPNEATAEARAAAFRLLADRIEQGCTNAEALLSWLSPGRQPVNR